VLVVVEQVSLATARTQLELQAVQVDSVAAVAVVGQHKPLAAQEYSTFSIRKHYDL
jgi:hypothetical protein